MKEFPTSYMGSMGGIFAHGGTKTAVRMRRWLQRGRPTVMLYNTGGVTQVKTLVHHSHLAAFTQRCDFYTARANSAHV